MNPNTCVASVNRFMLLGRLDGKGWERPAPPPVVRVSILLLVDLEIDAT